MATHDDMSTTVRVHADHTMTKHLGSWTTGRIFEERARRGAAVIDLRSPGIAEGDLELRVDLDHAMVKLLVPADATIDRWDLQWTGSGRVKDDQGTGAKDGRRVRVTGRVNNGGIRIHRGGLAILSAMFSRAFLDGLRQACRSGTEPTVDDPSRPTPTK
jgi:hypothetical protein